MKEYIDILSRSQLFMSMSRKETEAALERLSARVRKYRKGSRIVRRGDKISSLCVTLSGNAVISRDDFWGNSSVISDLKPPMCFGLSYALATDRTADVDVTAETDVSVMYFDTDNLLDAAPSVMIRNLIVVIADKNVMLSSKIDHISQRRLRDKVLSYLSSQRDKTGSNSFDIPFSRRQLADYLCADRSALSNELCKLRDEGIIRFNKNHFCILK